MLYRAFSELIERIGEVDSLMQFAVGVDIGIMPGFVLVELLTVFEDVCPVFCWGSVAIISMTVREQIVDLLPSESASAVDEDMRVKGFAFVPFFVAHTPVQRLATDTGENFNDFLVSEPFFKGIVDRYLPLAG